MPRKENKMFRVKTTVLMVLAIALVLTGPGRLRAQKKPAADSSAGSSIEKTISRLAKRDSSLMLDKKLSAEDYMERREKFFYPHTRREDPFEFPFTRSKESVGTQPKLGEIELVGVLFSQDGRSIAIMAVQDTVNFLVRVGDKIDRAEVVMIEATRIHLRVSEYGQVRNIIKELKPLVEANNAKISQQAGGSGRTAGETEPE